MDTPPERVVVPTHLSPRDPGTISLGPLSAEEHVEVTLRLRPQVPGVIPDGPAEARGSSTVAEPRYPSREEFARIHGADPQDIVRIEQFARSHGLSVTEADPALRSVKLAGPAPVLGQALGVTLSRYQGKSGFYRSADGPVRLPAELAPIVQSVIGLDDRPYAHRHESGTD
jgi:kumamolisin